MFNDKFKNQVNAKIEEILKEAYTDDDDFPYSCDLITKKLGMYIRLENQLSKDEKIYYVRGNRTSLYGISPHSYLEFHKNEKLVLIIDPTSYQFVGDSFYNWEKDYFKMSRDEALTSLIKINPIYIKDEIDGYVPEFKIIL